MQLNHIKLNKWQTSHLLTLCSVSLVLLMILVSGSEAIVKQQQRSDDSQQASNSGAQQQQHQHHSSAYNNHQATASAQQQQQQASSTSQQSAQPQASYSPSVSSSGSASSSVGQQQQSSSVQNSPANNQPSVRNSLDQQVSAFSSNYAPSSASNQPMNQKSSYVDANAADSSYQAAANTVNMALANSGIFANSYNQPQGGAQVASSVGQSLGQNSAQSLNPVHYLYYPSKESSNSGANPKQAQLDSMSNAASTNYQSMALPSFDQFSGLNFGSANDAAASNQDASYLPQPGSSQLNSQLSQDSNAQNPNQYNNQQAQQGQSGAAHYQSDLSAFASQNGQQQQPQSAQGSAGSISFSGPTSGSASDYLNSQLSHQQMQPSNYQASLFNQVGDLSTSNFGANQNGLGASPSYMAPGQSMQSGAGSSHDLFSGSASLLGQQFNSAASQLSPAAVSPPQTQQNPSSALGGSSLFGSSLFANQQQSQQPQQSAQGSAGANNLFANQHYLNSFMSPQQYQQAQQQQQDGSQSMATSASSNVQTSSSSNKRFGISSFIMPMLALAGLSLLIPTMSNIGTAVGRKKRSVEDRASGAARHQDITFESMNGASQVAKELSIGEYLDKIERYYSIYKNAVESDDCLNRLICEFGDAVKDVTGKAAVMT